MWGGCFVFFFLLLLTYCVALFAHSQWDSLDTSADAAHLDRGADGKYGNAWDVYTNAGPENKRFYEQKVWLASTKQLHLVSWLWLQVRRQSGGSPGSLSNSRQGGFLPAQEEPVKRKRKKIASHSDLHAERLVRSRCHFHIHLLTAAQSKSKESYAGHNSPSRITEKSFPGGN